MKQKVVRNSQGSEERDGESERANEIEGDVEE